MGYEKTSNFTAPDISIAKNKRKSTHSIHSIPVIYVQVETSEKTHIGITNFFISRCGLMGQVTPPSLLSSGRFQAQGREEETPQGAPPGQAGSLQSGLVAAAISVTAGKLNTKMPPFLKNPKTKLRARHIPLMAPRILLSLLSASPF